MAASPGKVNVLPQVVPIRLDCCTSALTHRHPWRDAQAEHGVAEEEGVPQAGLDLPGGRGASPVESAVERVVPVGGGPGAADPQVMSAGLHELNDLGEVGVVKSIPEPW